MKKALIAAPLALLALAACNKTETYPEGEASGQAAGSTTEIVPGPATTDTVVVPGATSTVAVPVPGATVTTAPNGDRVTVGPDGARVDVGGNRTRATIDVGPTPRATITTRP